MKDKIVLLIVGIILSIAITTSGNQISRGLHDLSNSTVNNENNVHNEEKINMSLPEAAAYLSLTEPQLKKIIALEKHQLETTGSFSGLMLPYFMINSDYYFNKEALSEWAKEVSREKRLYLNEGILN